jgi:hypothetical protein
MRLYDPHHCPDVVEYVRMGIVHIFALGDSEQSPIAFQGLLYCLDRSRPPR